MKHTISKLFSSVVILLMTTYVQAQDIIVTNDAQKIDAKIIEVSKSEIRYKETDNLDGPTFVIETADVSTIIYSNGKVVLYNKENPQNNNKEQEVKVQNPIEPSSGIEDIKYFFDGLNEQERYTLTKYLEGYPKNIVAIKGDYSMIYDKKCRIYFDFNFIDAEYGVYEVDRQMDEYTKIGDFNQYIANENVEIDINATIQSACEMFNKKMLNKKCTFLPITELDSTASTAQDYKMILHIKRIDVGNRVFTGGTTTGGAIICGYIEIKQVSSNLPICVLIVDRVQGIGNVRESVRIQNAIKETISNKLFSIKEYKLYSKEF